MRTISSSIMAALVVVALFWGNCFSCPQVLQALKAHPSHGCCPRTKHQTGDCKTQSLAHFVKADAATYAPSMPVAAEVIRPITAIAMAREIAPLPVVHAPPDLLSLYSTLRI